MTGNFTLEDAFNTKLTENGDIAFTKTGNNNLLNILFLTEYYSNHLDEVSIGTTERDKMFARFVRDPRHGLGKRDLGRILMHLSGCSIEEIVKSGRVDDLFIYNAKSGDYELSKEVLDYLYTECKNGNELVKKWMPRYSSKNLMIARAIAKAWGMNKQTYGKFVKCNTTEQKLSRKTTDDINFEHVPSLAMLKYYQRFACGKDTKDRFEQYLEDVRSGKKEIKVSTATVYDIYKNRDKIDADLIFNKIEKIALSCVPVVDSSGSMQDKNDSYGKAMAIGHYLAKCSTYAPNKVISFSSRPALLTLGVENIIPSYYGNGTSKQNLSRYKNGYAKEIASMYTGDCSNTDLVKVMECLKTFYLTIDNKVKYPEFIVILSDMEFDMGSSYEKDELVRIWNDKGYNTKIVWWNLNSRNITVPEMDHHGNIYMSGYSPMLLKFLQVGFDGETFLNTLIDEYTKVINK